MKKSNKGFTLVELLVVIAILGVLMGALVPNIMGAITKSQMTAWTANGRKIVEAIIAEQASGDDYWPHLTEKDGLGDDTDEVNGNVYGSSTEYFKKLFRVQDQTSSKWSPYIDKKLIECLWGNGVPAATPGNLEQRNVGWSVVAGASGVNSPVPALVTRNVDTSSFPTSGDNDMSKQKTDVGLEKYPAPFGTKGCVIVMTDGGAKSYEPNKCKLSEIYEKRVVSVPEGITLKYLEP